MRDVFQKEIKKIPKPRSGEQGSPSSVDYTGKWPHFHDMWFLKDVMIPRPTQHNYSDDQDQNDQGNVQDDSTVTQEQSGEESTVQPISGEAVSGIQQKIDVRDSPPRDSQLMDISERRTQKPTSSKITTSRKRKAAPPDLSEFQKRMLQIEQDKLIAFKEKHGDADTDDEDTYFLKSLAPYFKGLDPVQKLRLRSKIQNLIADEIASSSTASSSPAAFFATPGHNQYAAYPNTASTTSSQYSDLVEETISQQW